jgi:hypothetical protein
MNWLPEGQTFNSKYLCERLLPDLHATRPSHRKCWKKPVIILHMDSTNPHRSKIIVQKMAESKKTNVLHLSSSPDIAPSAFLSVRLSKRLAPEKGIPQQGTLISNSVRISLSDSSKNIADGSCRMNEETGAVLWRKWQLHVGNIGMK